MYCGDICWCLNRATTTSWSNSHFNYICVCSSEDDQKEKSLSHHTIQQLIMEKDQALADLNSVEKSLADLFRRYEKMKDVLEGFRKVTSLYRSNRLLLILIATLVFFFNFTLHLKCLVSLKCFNVLNSTPPSPEWRCFEEMCAGVSVQGP